MAARSGGGLVSAFQGRRQAGGREDSFVLCWASGLVRAIELVGQTGHTLTRLRDVARGKMERSVQYGKFFLLNYKTFDFFNIGLI